MRPEMEIVDVEPGVVKILHLWVANGRKLFLGISISILASSVIVVGGVPDDWFGWLVRFPFLAIGSYLAIAWTFNRTEVTAGRERIWWRHGPWPLLPGGGSGAGQIEEIQYGRVAKGGSATTPHFAVAVKKRNGGAGFVLDGLRSQTTAQIAAVRMAAALGCPAREIPLRHSKKWAKRAAIAAAAAAFLVVAILMYDVFANP